MPLAYPVFAALFGLVIGSFMNAYIWRVHTKRSISHGRSLCPRCKHLLTALDLLPVVSWLWLRGRCRHCSKPISRQYPVVELIVGVAAALSTLAWQPSNLTDAVQLGIWIVISGLFVALAVYDLRWMLLPNRLLKALLGVVIVFLLTQAFSGALLASWLVDPLIGASGALALFYGLHVLGRGAWMGGGDVKLVFILGLLLGWQLMALGLLLAFNLAAVISLLLIGLGWRSRQDLIPFGPFLLLGAWIALLWGEGIVDWYLRLSGL